jgi:iron complex outermembrane receptor protein
MNLHPKRFAHVPAGLLLALCCAGLAFAQNPDPVLEEIIVSATKRDTIARETPVALTAFTSDDLDAAGITKLDDIVMFTPGLYIGGDNGFGSNTMSIRGLGSLNLSIGADEAVGVYIDGVYQGRPYGNQFEFVDVAQIEVLRGPQGTLYGRNATGGAILINTVKPSENTIVKGDIGFGNYSSFQSRALVSGAIANSDVYGKLAIANKSMDGWASNPLTGEKVNGFDDLYVSGALRKEVGEVWDLTLSAYYGNQDNTTSANNPLDDYPDDQFPATFPNAADREYSGITLNIIGHFEPATFITTTGYAQGESETRTTSGNEGITNFIGTRDSDQVYQEFRLTSNSDGRFSWLIAATGFKESPTDYTKFVITPPAGGPTGFGIVFDSRLETTSYAGFAQLGFSITDKLEVTAGARYTNDKKKWTNCGIFGAYGNIYDPIADTICEDSLNSETLSWSETTPSLLVDYRFTDNVFAYVSYTEGFRSGGWNQTTPVNPALPYVSAFNPEYADSYEMGLKAELLDGRMRADVAIYSADYDDLQVRTVDPVYALTGVQNAGAAETKGVEFQAIFVPSDAWMFSTNITWQDAEYTEFNYFEQTGEYVDYAGNTMNNAPEWQLGFSAEYSKLLSGGGTLSPRLDAGCISEVFFNETNSYPYNADGHENINLSLLYTTGSGQWSWRLYMNNVTDDDSRTYAYPGLNAGIVGALYVLPRTYGLQLIWNDL